MSTEPASANANAGEADPNPAPVQDILTDAGYGNVDIAFDRSYGDRRKIILWVDR